MNQTPTNQTPTNQTEKNQATYTPEYIPGILFWNVDTQYDFMRNDESFKGALAVAGARVIEGNLERLTQIAEDYQIRVVNTADWHTIDDVEIDAKNPDYRRTYPPHCMAGTKGAEYVPATMPKNAYVLNPEKTENFDGAKITDYRNIVLHKNHFDVFKGNYYADKVVEMLKPEKVIVYGVATNVCVNFAVQGLLDRKCEVYVVTDAIKELPNEIAETPMEQILDSWKGVKQIRAEDVTKLVRKHEMKQTIGWLKNQDAMA